MVAGGFGLLVATQGAGVGMCLIWSGKIWCREILTPVCLIELKILEQNTGHTCTTSIDGD